MGTRLFIETGTYRGDTLAAVHDVFDTLYSIELSADLHVTAVRRFNGNCKMRLLHGDSAKELGRLLAGVAEPALFWLDAHYWAGVTARAFEETPIRAELEAVFMHPVQGHVILIDDARYFAPAHGYSAIAEVCAYEEESAPDFEMSIEHDIKKIVPKQATQD